MDELLQEDLRRLQERQRESDGGSATTSRPDESPLQVQDIVDKALIADFFFILFALAWLGVGVGVKSSTGNTVCSLHCFHMGCLAIDSSNCTCGCRAFSMHGLACGSGSSSLLLVFSCSAQYVFL